MQAGYVFHPYKSVAEISTSLSCLQNLFISILVCQKLTQRDLNNTLRHFKVTKIKIFIFLQHGLFLSRRFILSWIRGTWLNLSCEKLTIIFINFTLLALCWKGNPNQLAQMPHVNVNTISCACTFFSKFWTHL